MGEVWVVPWSEFPIVPSYPHYPQFPVVFRLHPLGFDVRISGHVWTFLDTSSYIAEPILHDSSSGFKLGSQVRCPVPS